MIPFERITSRASVWVTPSARRSSQIDGLASDLLARTARAALKFKETRGALLGGSYAKGTWLPDEVDLDVFVRFDPSTPEDAFEKAGLAIGAAATRGYPRGKKYAQHPYTEATVEGVKVNIVPCFAVSRGRWMSAADRSPFHVDLIKALSGESKTQVRLLKKFMKAVGVYGAEIQTEGFSGYVAEVLVAQLGTFQRVLDHFAGFSFPVSGRLFTLPDPVDSNRDLGTAVSARKLGEFILASREFLKRPSLTYFRKMSGKSNPTLRDSVVAVVFSHQALSEDTLWGELRKTSKHLASHLEAKGFKVARWMAASNNRDRSAVLFIPEYSTLPPFEQRVGPTVDRRKDVDAFIAANSGSSRLMWVDDQARVRLLRPRSRVRIADLLQDVARGRAGHIGASAELEKGMKKSARVLQGRALARAASSSGWLTNGIAEITTDALGTRAH